MRRLAVIVAALLLGAAMVPLGGAVAADLDSELEKVGNEIESVKQQIASASQQRTALAEDILATDARLHEVVDDLELAEADLAAVETEMALTAEHLAEVREQLEAQYASLQRTRFELETARVVARERALRIYMGGGQEYGSVIFSVEEMAELAVSLQYASRIADSTEELVRRLETLEIQAQRQAQRIDEQEDELETEVSRLDEQRIVLDELTAQVAAAKAEVERELANQQAQLNQVRAELDFFDNELDALEAEQSRIENLIRSQQSSGGSAPGVFVRPVPGPITSGFGYRVHPILGTRRLHTGIDMGSGYGTPILAAAAGRVILASFYGGYGNAIIIDHGGGVSTLYAHQSRLAVSNGSQVSAGQTIGYVGSTGLSTGPHLHFEVRQNGSPVNPAPYL